MSCGPLSAAVQPPDAPCVCLPFPGASRAIVVGAHDPPCERAGHGPISSTCDRPRAGLRSGVVHVGAGVVGLSMNTERFVGGGSCRHVSSGRPPDVARMPSRPTPVLRQPEARASSSLWHGGHNLIQSVILARDSERLRRGAGRPRVAGSLLAAAPNPRPKLAPNVLVRSDRRVWSRAIVTLRLRFWAESRRPSVRQSPAQGADRNHAVPESADMRRPPRRRTLPS